MPVIEIGHHAPVSPVSCLIYAWSAHFMLEQGVRVSLYLSANRQMIDEAVAAANASDLTIALLGDSPSTCGEGTDRTYSVQ